VTFSGRFGPIDCKVSSSDLLYVARFEFSGGLEEGVISVVNSQGQIKENFTLQGVPEITGIAFSRSANRYIALLPSMKDNILYITENSKQSQCIRVLVPSEEKEDQHKSTTEEYLNLS